MLFIYFGLLLITTAGVHGDKRCIDTSGEFDDDSTPGRRLLPGVHWAVDTTRLDNLVPIAPEAPCDMYYGVDDPNEEGYFGFLTYYFSYSAVVLDHSSLVTAKYDQINGELRIEFENVEAFSIAAGSWSVEGGLVLAVYADGCATAKDDRCYFNTLALYFDEANLVIIATGFPQDPDSMAIFGEAEWGYWEPQSSGSSSPGGSNQGPGTGSGPGTNSGDEGGVNPGAPSPQVPGDSNESTDTFGDRTRCVAPVDAVYGLPTACLGDYFDLDLDEQQGYADAESNALFQAFLSELDPEEDQDGELSTKLARRLGRRGVADRIKEKLLGAVPKGVTKLGGALLDKAKQATSISGSFNKDFPFQIPNPSSDDAGAKTPKDSSIKQVQSPWGNALLLKSFGKEDEMKEKQGKSGYLNIYCVDCGVKGNVNIAGRAKWSPLDGGFTQGEVEMKADLNIIFKLGVDAKLQYQKDFNNVIFETGLPSLSYGVVIIGPKVSFGTRTSFVAAAEGQLLAGAEMGLSNAQVLLDFVSPSKSKTSGWEPHFKPVFEASGSIKLSAELGLPISLKCGLKIAKWDKNVGITEEPSIKATAQVSASVGLQGNSFAAGFTETNGCTGISTQISWRNRVFYNILDSEKEIFDTKDKLLKQGCIELPGKPSAPETPTPGNPTPENPTPGNPTPGNPAPENPIPENPTPENPIPENPTPENPTPEDPTPEIPTPENPAPENPTPEDPTPEDPTPEVPTTGEPDPEGPAVDAQEKRQTIDAGVSDLTDSVRGETTISYTPRPAPNEPYNTTDNYEFSLIVDTQATLMLVSCGDGNIYVTSVDVSDSTTVYCSEMWSVYNNLLVGDGPGRVIHYYKNTMDKIGVSRLRVSDDEILPAEAVAVALAPYESGNDTTTITKRQNETESSSDSTDNEDFGYEYYAVDPEFNLFYLAVCTYANNAMPRLFLIRDPEAGITALQNKDIEYSVTGGIVETCSLIPLVEGKYEGDLENEFGKYNDNTDAYLDYESPDY